MWNFFVENWGTLLIAFALWRMAEAPRGQIVSLQRSLLDDIKKICPVWLDEKGVVVRKREPTRFISLLYQDGLGAKLLLSSHRILSVQLHRFSPASQDKIEKVFWKILELHRIILNYEIEHGLPSEQQTSRESLGAETTLRQIILRLEEVQPATDQEGAPQLCQEALSDVDALIGELRTEQELVDAENPTASTLGRLRGRSGGSSGGKDTGKEKE